MKFLVAIFCFVVSTVSPFSNTYPLNEEQQKKILDLVLPVKSYEIKKDTFNQIQAYYTPEELNRLPRNPFGSNAKATLVDFEKNGFKTKINVQIRHALVFDKKDHILLILEFNQIEAPIGTPGLIGIATVGHLGTTWKVESPIKYATTLGYRGDTLPSEVMKIGHNERRALVIRGAWEADKAVLTGVQVLLLEKEQLIEVLNTHYTTGNAGHCRPKLADTPFEDRLPSNVSSPKQDPNLPECYSYAVDFTILDNKSHDGLYDIKLSEEGMKLNKKGIAVKANDAIVYSYSGADKKYIKVKP